MRFRILGGSLSSGDLTAFSCSLFLISKDHSAIEKGDAYKAFATAVGRSRFSMPDLCLLTLVADAIMANTRGNFRDVESLQMEMKNKKSLYSKAFTKGLFRCEFSKHC